MDITPVIMSGGNGSRLWPQSRSLYPKQFLSLVNDYTLFQNTVARLEGLEAISKPLVIANEEHRFLVAEQFREMGKQAASIILEPFGRNTAPAVALAALKVFSDEDDPVLLVLAADHVIEDVEAFHQAINVALPAARDGLLVTFGIVPTHAETGYGYIKASVCHGGSVNVPDNTDTPAIHGSRTEGRLMFRTEPALPPSMAGARSFFKKERLENSVSPCLGGNKKIYPVEKFVEKPDLATAQEYVASGHFYWNSGMFMFKASRYLEELKKYRPDILEVCKKAIVTAKTDLNFVRLNEEAFKVCPDESIDYAVMEKTTDAVVVPLDAGWSDIGSWSSLWDISEKDEQGNSVQGDALLHDTHNTYVRSENKLIATVGVEDLIITESDDAILVSKKDRVQDVKKVVEQLKANHRPEVNTHRKVYRPWGAYDPVDDGDRFQVKHITVKPGEKLTLHKHYHRAEHWVVVRGTALVMNGERKILLAENESTYIPVGVAHRLENPGKVELELIEVQSGCYLGEDDIVRV